MNYRKILDYWICLSIEGKLLAFLGLCIYMKFYFVFLYLASSKKGIGNNKLFNRILLLRIAELSCFNNQCTCSLCIVTRAFGGYCNLELSVLESSGASCYSLKTKVRILTWRFGHMLFEPTWFKLYLTPRSSFSRAKTFTCINVYLKWMLWSSTWHTNNLFSRWYLTLASLLSLQYANSS